MSESVRIEGLSEFLAALKKYAPEVRKHFMARMRVVAAQIVSQARDDASWSTRIPSAIGPVATSKTIGVRVSKKKAPHGGLYERGAKGSRSDFFRHPLFGNKDFWFAQPIRPFLKPAMAAKHEEAIAGMIRAVEETERELRMR